MRGRFRLGLVLLCVACHGEAQKPVHTATHVPPATRLHTEPVITRHHSTIGTHQTVVAEPRDTAPVLLHDAGSTPALPVYPFQQVEVLERTVARDAAARRFANLSSAACARELKAQKYPFKRVGAFKGIATPVRVDGEIEGVKFRVPGAKSKFGVLDCRLALTLVEFGRFLKSKGVTQVTVDNFYRPNARLPSRRSKRSQHAYGLAIDLTSFVLADGRILHVENDWGAGVDSEPCGPHASMVSPTDNSVELRQLVCDLVDQQLFHHHLTPSYDVAHRNHLHLDIKRDERMVTAR